MMMKTTSPPPTTTTATTTTLHQVLSRAKDVLVVEVQVAVEVVLATTAVVTTAMSTARMEQKLRDALGNHKLYLWVVILGLVNLH